METVAPYHERLRTQAVRARQLADDPRCPHCLGVITTLDALSMVRGHGVRYYVQVELPDGRSLLVREADFSPQTMLFGTRSSHGNRDAAR